VVVIEMFLAVPGPLTRTAEKHPDGDSRIASTLTSLAARIRESEAVLRHPDWRLFGRSGSGSSTSPLWIRRRAGKAFVGRQQARRLGDDGLGA
jgi:hypothetical protein